MLARQWHFAHLEMPAGKFSLHLRTLFPSNKLTQLSKRASAGEGVRSSSRLFSATLGGIRPRGGRERGHLQGGRVGRTKAEAGGADSRMNHRRGVCGREERERGSRISSSTLGRRPRRISRKRALMYLFLVGEPLSPSPSPSPAAAETHLVPSGRRGKGPKASDSSGMHLEEEEGGRPASELREILPSHKLRTSLAFAFPSSPSLSRGRVFPPNFILISKNLPFLPLSFSSGAPESGGKEAAERKRKRFFFRRNGLSRLEKEVPSLLAHTRARLVVRHLVTSSARP